MEIIEVCNDIDYFLFVVIIPFSVQIYIVVEPYIAFCTSKGVNIVAPSTFLKSSFGI